MLSALTGFNLGFINYPDRNKISRFEFDYIIIFICYKKIKNLNVQAFVSQRIHTFESLHFCYLISSLVVQDTTTVS
jgi:hypothetical protein